MAWVLEEGPSADTCGFIWTPEILRSMEKMRSWTAQVDGDPLACGGLVEFWPGRYQAWSFLNERTGPFMRWITRETKARLQAVEGRIEMTVRKDFEKGHRWAQLLGFEVETPILRAFGPNGEDHVGYVMLAGGS